VLFFVVAAQRALYAIRGLAHEARMTDRIPVHRCMLLLRRNPCDVVQADPERAGDFGLSKLRILLRNW
jgi:hypothetical protein